MLKYIKETIELNLVLIRMIFNREYWLHESLEELNISSARLFFKPFVLLGIFMIWLILLFLITVILVASVFTPIMMWVGNKEFKLNFKFKNIFYKREKEEKI